MKVLVVASGNSGKISPFVKEQVDSLSTFGIEFDYFLIRRRHTYGYLSSYPPLKRKISIFNPDIIHSHFGLSGLLANFQRKIPVVATFHGSDINNKFIKCFSILAAKLSAYSIFVSQEMLNLSRIRHNYSVIPCGIPMDVFVPIPKALARKKLNLISTAPIGLFAGSFSNNIKNYKLCQKAVRILNKKPIIIETKGYDRNEVNLLLNACDFAIMTSKNEGSPQFIKEAMSVGCPIVSTPVGDVQSVIGKVEGCFLTKFEASDIAGKIELAVKFAQEKGKTNGRARILELGLDTSSIAKQIIGIYQFLVKEVL